MTRRLTVGSRSEMGLLCEQNDPETPPPLWTPPKTDFWKRRSRWQICLPRLWLVTKVSLLLFSFLVLLRIYYDKHPVLVDQQAYEAEIMEAAQRNNWLWKDFPRLAR